MSAKRKWSGPMKKSIAKVSSPKGRSIRYVSNCQTLGGRYIFSFSTDKKDACALTKHQVRLVGVFCQNSIVERLPPNPCLIPSALSMRELLNSAGARGGL